MQESQEWLTQISQGSASLESTVSMPALLKVYFPQ